ncbi:AhpC-TSA domain containing protein [Naviculisporaceae sp. PSN 640]
MPVELRKRKAPVAPPAPPPKKQTKATSTATKVKEAVKETAKKAASTANGAATKAKEVAAAAAPAPTGKPSVGDIISLDGFGGEIETNDGAKTTLKALVDESKAGVVLFTYPRASTPGCTKQACLFRDRYTPLTASGLSIYGLSTDSPKANTTFKEKQKLPYPLLCDPSASLIGAIGLKKAPKGTTRGVFVIDKSGKVLAAEPGGPDGTVAVVEKIVEGLKGDAPAPEKAEAGAETKTKTAEEAKLDVAHVPDVPAVAAEKKDEEKPVENVATEEKKTEEVNGETEKQEDEKKPGEGEKKE